MFCLDYFGSEVEINHLQPLGRTSLTVFIYTVQAYYTRLTSQL